MHIYIQKLNLPGDPGIPATPDSPESPLSPWRPVGPLGPLIGSLTGVPSVVSPLHEISSSHCPTPELYLSSRTARRPVFLFRSWRCGSLLHVVKAKRTKGTTRVIVFITVQVEFVHSICNLFALPTLHHIPACKLTKKTK